MIMTNCRLMKMPAFSLINLLIQEKLSGYEQKIMECLGTSFAWNSILNICFIVQGWGGGMDSSHADN